MHPKATGSLDPSTSYSMQHHDSDPDQSGSGTAFTKKRKTDNQDESHCTKKLKLDKLPAALSKKIKGKTITRKIQLLSENEDLLKPIREGEDVNKQDSKGQTIMHRLAATGNINQMRELFDMSSPTLNLRDHEGKTPLHLAALSGEPSVIQLLTERMALDPVIELMTELKKEDGDGLTPLFCAILSQKPPVVQLFIDKHPEIIKKAFKKELIPLIPLSPLSVAAIANNPLILTQLIHYAESEGIEISRYLLCIAVAAGSHLVTNELLNKYKENPNKLISVYNLNPLHIASFSVNRKKAINRIAEMIVLHNPEFMRGHQDEIQCWQSRASENLKKIFPIFQSNSLPRNNLIETVRTLIRYGSSINAQDDIGKTPLDYILEGKQKLAMAASTTESDDNQSDIEAEKKLTDELFVEFIQWGALDKLDKDKRAEALKNFQDLFRALPQKLHCREMGALPLDRLRYMLNPSTQESHP